MKDPSGNDSDGDRVGEAIEAYRQARLHESRRPAPVRVLESPRYRRTGLGRLETRAFCGLGFAAEAPAETRGP